MPLYSVVAAAVVLLCAAAVIAAVARRQRRGPASDGLGLVLGEVAEYERELSREVDAGSFAAYGDWGRDRIRLAGLMSELDVLAAASAPDRARRVAAVQDELRRWMGAVDALDAAGAVDAAGEAVPAQERAVEAAARLRCALSAAGQAP